MFYHVSMISDKILGKIQMISPRRKPINSRLSRGQLNPFAASQRQGTWICPQIRCYFHAARRIALHPPSAVAFIADQAHRRMYDQNSSLNCDKWRKKRKLGTAKANGFKHVFGFVGKVFRSVLYFESLLYCILFY